MIWSEAKHLATLLVAQDRLTNPEIGKRCGVTGRSIETWKRDPEFKAEVQAHLNAWREKIGIADPSRRLFQLNDRWRRCQTVIAKRAADPKMQQVTGGATGMLAHYRRVTRHPDGTATIVDEYETDHSLLREMRELEAQAAAELGHWDRANRGPTAPVVLVVSQGTTNIAAATQGRLSDVLAQTQTPVAQLPGVVIDLVPESGSRR